MKIPTWFTSLLRKKTPEAPLHEMDIAYSDYMRSKYGIAQPFADEESK
jgi:hypothetical protein